MKKILLVICVICLGLGILCKDEIYNYYKEHNKSVATAIENDDSFKVKTEKDKSNNGLYSLTLVDEESGRNTWDGLVLYVEEDVVKYGFYVDADTLYECQQRNSNATFANMGKYDKWDDIDYYVDHVKRNPDDREDYVAWKGYDYEFNYLEKDIHLANEYRSLSKYGLMAGYDEESNEIWLSKLLNNPDSQYSSDNYKLIHDTDVNNDIVGQYIPYTTAYVLKLKFERNGYTDHVLK